MALQKQAISINLSAGLDTKTDSKHVVAGKLTKLENGVYRKGMALEKRRGYDEIKNTSSSEGSLPTGSSLQTFNEELLQLNRRTLFSYVQTSNRWVSKGTAQFCEIESSNVIKNTATQSYCDSAVSNNIGVYAWEDSRGGIRATIVDEITSVPIVSDLSLNANVSLTRPRCFAIGQYIYVFWVNATDLEGFRLNTRKPYSFGDYTQICNDIDATNPNYDMIVVGGSAFVVYNTGSDSKSKWFDADFTELDTVYAEKTYASAPFTACCNVVERTDDDGMYVFFNDGTNIKSLVLDEFGNLESTDTFSGTWTNVSNICAVDNSTTLSSPLESFDVFWTVPGGTTDTTSIYKAGYITGLSPSGTQWLLSVGLYTKPFVFESAEDDRRTICVGVVHESELQSTYFVVVTSNQAILGKQQYTNGGGLRTRPLLANVSQDGSGIFKYSILRKNRIISENATIFTPTGVMKTQVNFTRSNRFNAKQLGNNLLISGGILNMYDGQSIVEHGFLLYPERVVAAAVGSGGSLADGSYQIYVVYEWTDNFGQIHRSRPSVPVTVTCAAGGSDSITVTAPTLRLTAKKLQTSRSDISIVGYITEANGSIAYRFTSVTTPILNDVTADTVSLGTITSVTISNEILYTTGSVLANDPAPACSVIEVFQNRVWLAGLEESSSLVYSKETKSGFPVEFTDEFTKAIESSGGRVKALSFIDDKIMIFKADKAYFTYGEGPNDTNTLGGFAEIESISSDVGSENPRSFTKIPNAIIFKSKKGFYAIDSSLSSSYIGADVEGFNDLTVTSANLLPDLNEVRFSTSDGDLLIYNYYFAKWSTIPNLKSASGTLWKNKLVLLKTDGTIFAQNPDSFKDANAGYGMKIESGWIALGSLNSYKRIYELMVFGNYKSKHKIRVKVAYDNDDSWVHSGVYDPTTEFPVEFYGDDSPYGESGTVYGGKPIDYAIRVRLKKQKCSSFKFQIEELTYSETTGTHEALVISDIGILVGMKQGAVKKSQSRNMKMS